MRTFVTLLFSGALLFITMTSGAITIDRIEPANWWVGMKNSQLQLLVHGHAVSDAQIHIAYPGVTMEKTDRTSNKDYVFVTLHIAPEAKAGAVPITFSLTGMPDTLVQFPLLERKTMGMGKSGFSPADAIYLITPDRFAAGNYKAPALAKYTDTVDRANPNARHGGTISGITEHLNHIANLGFTAIWINPLLENNMPGYSYHGYAITDYYLIDPRFGTINDYCTLVAKSHEAGLKVIMDVVLNHCGSNYWWHNNLPDPNWYHTFDTFTRTTYRASTLLDIHAADTDKQIFTNGWFDGAMPDLNQSNEFVANYLIQNTIWWIETSGIDALRLDTQPYSDMLFLQQWITAINDEYPAFTVVGEAWFSNEAFTAAFQRSNHAISSYQSKMHSVTDFPLCFALSAAVNDTESWDNGLIKIYNVLAHDFLYGDPNQNMIFFSNHDLSRVYESINGEIKKYKMLVAMLATLRGMPQFYYADEILMPGNKAKGDGNIRKDMPGGWPNDTINVFTRQNLSATQLEALTYTSSIFNWRKHSSVVANGTFKHFIPRDGLYVYCRYNTGGTVLVLVNNNEKRSIPFDTKYYAEILKTQTTAHNPIENKNITLDKYLVPAKSAVILELK